MARIKAEVKEHAQQQRLARQHHRQHLPQPSPVPFVAPPSAPAPVEVKMELVSPPPVAADSRCVDLTADEETEDEEDADEPFAATALRIPDGQHGRERGEELEVPLDVEMEATEEQDEACEGGERQAAPKETVSAAFAPAVDDEETDESEVDEEMPLARPRSVDLTPQEEPSAVGSMTGGVRAVVDKISHALSAVMPTFGLAVTTSEDAVDGQGEDELVRQGESDKSAEASRLDDATGGNEEEEEEDEQWPELRTHASSEEEKQNVSADEDVPSTASEGEEGGGEGSIPDRAGAVKTGNPLEDGEIFEEGAVAKSPTAVKEAIELELLARAVASSKKKQKKRGRKKNKRKVEVMLASSQIDQEQVDEFGRNVRHQPMPPSVSVTTASHLHDFLPSIAIQSTPQPIDAGAHGSPLLTRPPLMAPPIPQHPPPLSHDFGNSHVHRQLIDDQIVRVNRHGGFEPFAFHGNRAPRPPIAPPFLPPPPPPPSFRYVSLDYFSPQKNDGVSSPNRGLKRPLPQAADTPSVPVTDTSEVAFDLDSLRAAALKTKRKAPAKECTAPPAAAPVIESVDAPTTDRPVDAPPPTATAHTEEDPSLDALRMELLKSMRRKRREVSGQSTITEATNSLSDELSQKGTDVSNQDTQIPSQEAQVAPTPTPPEPPVPESPQFRPLTAMNQSLVIRLSLDDLSSEQTKDRADSYDDAAKRFDKVLDDIRAEAASTKTVVALVGSNNPSSVHKEREPSAPSVQVSPPKQPVDVPNKQIETPKSKEGDVASLGLETMATEAVDSTKLKTAAQSKLKQETTGVGTQQVVLNAGVAVDADVLADPTKLEAERQACLANIREADAHIARLDAEIAALRLVIATRDAETSNTSSSATACGA